jgi:hypothetical protein
MAQSTDEPDGKRREPDPGYEVLPDEEEERYGPEVRRQNRGRRRRREPEPDLKRSPQKRRRPRPQPAVVWLLGITAAVATLPTAVVTLSGLVMLVKYPGKFFLGCTALVGYLVWLYGQTAWLIWQRRIQEIEFRRVAIASLGFGGLCGMCAVPVLDDTLRHAEETSTMKFVWLTVGVSAIVLAIAIGALSFFAGEHYRRRRDGK